MSFVVNPGGGETPNLYTPYTPTKWENKPSTATPITAERLNNIERGIQHSLHSRVHGCNPTETPVIPIYTKPEYVQNPTAPDFTFENATPGYYVQLAIEAPEGVDLSEPTGIAVECAGEDGSECGFGYGLYAENNCLYLLICVCNIDESSGTDLTPFAYLAAVPSIVFTILINWGNGFYEDLAVVPMTMLLGMLRGHVLAVQSKD